jgi:hypothetical protein
VLENFMFAYRRYVCCEDTLSNVEHLTMYPKS